MSAAAASHARRASKDDSLPAASPASPNGKAADAKAASTSSTSAKADAAPAASAAEPAEPAEEAENETEDESIIDMETFQQILELDEDDSRTFSSEMVWQYFDQASSTFDEMDAAFEAKQMEKLSNLGHYLKGSSAALGVTKVQATCEKIQHYGKLWDDETGKSLTEKEALEKIGPLLIAGKKEYTDAEKWLRSWFGKQGVTGPPEAD